jgi:protein O-GlcNAc transferase
MTRAPHAPSPQELGLLQLYFGSGDVAATERLASELSRRFPDHAFAWKVLATIAIRAGRREAALAALFEARRAEPEDATTHGNLGVILQELGRLDEAEAAYREAIRRKPDAGGAHCNLGNALYALGRLDEAERSYREALRLAPGDATANCNLGNTLKDLGRPGEAEGFYRAALRADPDLAAAHYNLASVLKDLDRPREAEASYRDALRRAPGFAEAHYNLANTLKLLERLDEAELGYREALRLKPGHVEARNNLGNVLRDLGRLDEAEACFREALRLEPGYADAHANLGAALYRLGRVREAEASCRDALRFDPEHARAHNNLGNILIESNAFDEAETHLRRAIALNPTLTPLFDNLLYALNYHPDRSAADIDAAYAAYDRRFGAPHRAAIPRHANARAHGRRLRIGYVSPDFRGHSSRYFLEPLLANHDATAFELFAYAELGWEDSVTRIYKSYFEHWVETKAMDDDALCARIRADAIDVLVDLAGHTANNRLGVFARKPAPVSVSWLGYASTTGLRSIDYLLIDPVSAPPGSEPSFAETPWRLAAPAYVYRPASGMGPEGDLPALRRGAVTFGTLTRAVRINDRTVRTWARILDAVPHARLTIDSSSFGDPAACEALAMRLSAAGIARDRVAIGYHSPPWDVLREIDIGLDCFPHNSGVTLFETLYMGVPYVTLAGRPSVGLIGSSILEGAGHPEWIARTEDEYVAIAVRLAGDLPALAAIRGQLRARMASRPIMDERGFAARVETAYRRMFELWEAAPASRTPA